MNECVCGGGGGTCGYVFKNDYSHLISIRMV